MATERLQVILEMITGQYKKGAHEAAGATREVASSAEKAGGAATGLGGKLDKLSRGGLVGVTAGAVAAKQGFDATLGAAVSFDAKMTESLAIMGDVSDAMRGDMSDAAREVAKATTFSADQAAESYFFLASAGLDAKQSIEAMPAVARFAQAGMFDMALATDLATDAQSALGLASDDSAENLANLTRVTDVFTKANALANTSVQQIAEAMTNKAGAALRAVNKDVEEGSAVLAAFADQGLKGAAAGEALNIILRDLQRAALGNEEAFAAAGIAVFDQAGNMRNVADIVGELETRLDGMSDAQVRAELTTLGFQDRSISNLLTLLGTSDAIREYERELRSAGGATKEVADKQLQSATAQWELFKSQLADVGLEVGEDLLPTMTELLPTLRDSASTVGDVATSLAALLQVLQPVTYGLGQISSALNGTNEHLGVFNRVTGFGGDFLKGPVGFFIRAWESGEKFFGMLDDGPAKIDGISTGLQNHNDSLRRATSGYGQVGDTVGSADQAMQNMARRGLTQINGGLGQIPAAVANAVGPLDGLIGKLLEAQSSAEGVFNALRSASDPVFAAVQAWDSYIAALEAADEESAGAAEQFDVLAAKVDLRSALESLGSNYEEAMQALSLATGTPITALERLFEMIDGYDGQTFTAVFETEFRSRGTPGPGTGVPRSDPGVVPRQHGGPFERHQMFRGGELNQPEMMIIPGDRGRVFNHADTRALIAAAHAAFSQPATGPRGGDFIVNMQSQDPHIDAHRVGALRSVQHRMEADL